MHATCVDLTDVLGRGAPEQLRRGDRGRAAARRRSIARLIELVWSDRRLPGRRRLPQLPPPHDPPPPCVVQRRPSYDRERAARAGPRPTRATSPPGRASGSPAAGCAVCRARHRAPRPPVVRGAEWLTAVLDEARAQRARTSSRSTTRSPPRPGPATRAAGHDVGRAARPVDMGAARRSPSIAWAAREAELRVVHDRARPRPGRARAARAPVQRLGVPGQPRPRRRMDMSGPPTTPLHWPQTPRSRRRVIWRRTAPRRAGARPAIDPPARPDPSWEYPPVVEGGLARHVRKLVRGAARP